MQPGNQRTMDLREWALLVVLSVLWGGSFFFSKVALAELRPFSVVLARVALAAAALQLIVVLRGERLPVSWRLWGSFFAMGALNNLIPFSLIFYGQTQIASGLASILNATTPFWTVLLAHILTRDERLSWNRMAGVLLGVAGVVVIIGPELLGGLGQNLLAQLAVLAAAICYACAGIYGKRFQGIPPLVTAAGQVTGTAVMMLPVALVVDQLWTRAAPSLTVWGALAGLALLSTALAYNIYFRLLASAGATNLLLVTLLIPVSALFLGAMLLGERVTGGDLLGLACIGLGLAAIDGRLVRRARARARASGASSEPDEHRV